MAEGASVERARARIGGVVQGVGFRPHVARLARRFGLSGFVRNDGGVVTVEAEGPRDVLRLFFGEIARKAPRESKIETLDISWGLPPCVEERPGFAIRVSESRDRGLSMPSPDIALCADCLSELRTPGDPRYRNPFISCTLCGPRFSIMERLPYDRETTSMACFPMCLLCARQYADPDDRRCHAQTVCCNGCGPRLWYAARGETGERAAGEDALSRAVGALKNGGVVAVKGIGGYHLACSPFDGRAVARLRALKGREHKPFAVMFPDMASLRRHGEADAAEETLLRSPACPIVLTARRGDSAIVRGVSGESPRLGAFLPYAPLQVLLLDETGPLVMTSANLTGLPIIRDDADALDLLSRADGPDGVLGHDRPIVRGLDDSVADVVEGRPRVLRRARGYVPLPVEVPGLPDGPAVLAYGAQQKGVVCPSAGKYLFCGAETGDLESAQAQAAYREAVSDLERLTGIRPALAVCDLHPLYESTREAESSGLPVLRVQHHYAHIASVMAEDGLSGPVLGVAFDGTGYGTDGTVWGGEFLIASPAGFRRAGHLRPVRLLASDEAVRRADTTAKCLLLQAGAALADDPDVPVLRAALENRVGVAESSSMGRYFDAVSAILGICRYSEYEGRAAIDLENAAAHAHGPAEPFPFELSDAAENGAVTANLLPAVRAVWDAARAGGDPACLALRFHETVAALIVQMCVTLRARGAPEMTALSGGVFANRLLLARVLPALRREGFDVHINHEVPPGDGGISLGQAYIGRMRAGTGAEA